jgi:hypothetical protein
MNNLSDDDPQLTNFLKQHRSTAPIETIDLEDRLMSEIDSVATRTKKISSRRLWRGIFSGFGMIATGFVGATIHYVMNPPEPSVSELHQLDRYLVAHSRSFVVESVSIDNSDDLDAFILQDDDSENI